ncbi:hypothetical protein WQ54_28945 [Bacillus sp. SA1-12]|uniref:PepSY domain-containing protein n=1 Tax=Bacillus sp. SA1-12 TaxID=1455638 RepID=UPI00062724AB|nr:PepSY domain-containing protein [Bacillus sp. SA1-12]KKI88944.1 hypothetical protein WQ54_28945 [Bacillus sp. SA1-12]
MNPIKIICLFSFLIVGFIIAEVQYIFADRDSEILSAVEIKRNIQTKYLGDIRDIKLSKNEKNKMYVVNLHGQDREYTLKVDAYSGEILYLNQLENVASENVVHIKNEGIASFSSGEKGDGKLVKGKTSDCSVKIMNAKKS